MSMCWVLVFLLDTEIECFIYNTFILNLAALYILFFYTFKLSY